MKTLILAVLLAVAQAVFAVPGQATDDSAGASAKIKSQSSTSEKPVPPSAVSSGTEKAVSANRNTGEHGRQDAQNTVVIRELPPVTVNTRRNWADWGYWAFSGLLVVVSSLQVWLLWKTLGAITKQAEHMRDQTGILRDSVTAAQTSANAAAAQIQLMKDKERARVRIEFEPLDLSFNPIPGGYKVRFKVFLDGTTQAYIVETHCIAEIYDPDSTNYDIGGGMGLPQVITPAERVIEQSVALFTDSTSCPPELCDPNEERVQLAREGKLYVIVTGFIRYKDLFGGKWRVKFNRRWQYWGVPYEPDAVDLSGGTWESAGETGEYEEYEEKDEEEAN